MKEIKGIVKELFSQIGKKTNKNNLYKLEKIKG